MEQWADLPTPRARDKAKARFTRLEAEIDELRRQGKEIADAVGSLYHEMNDHQIAIAAAKRAMQSDSGERALRQRAEALRAVIRRIECTFTATGITGSGWGKRNSKLVKVTIYPISGDSVEFPTPSKGTLIYSNAHSFMNRTRFGSMR